MVTLLRNFSDLEVEPAKLDLDVPQEHRETAGHPNPIETSYPYARHVSDPSTKKYCEPPIFVSHRAEPYCKNHVSMSPLFNLAY